MCPAEVSKRDQGLFPGRPGDQTFTGAPAGSAGGTLPVSVSSSTAGFRGVRGPQSLGRAGETGEGWASRGSPKPQGSIGSASRRGKAPVASGSHPAHGGPAATSALICTRQAPAAPQPASPWVTSSWRHAVKREGSVPAGCPAAAAAEKDSDLRPWHGRRVPVHAEASTHWPQGVFLGSQRGAASCPPGAPQPSTRPGMQRGFNQ